MPPVRRQTRRQPPRQTPLYDQLALFDFLLAQLGFDSFERIADKLRSAGDSDADFEGRSPFMATLLEELPERAAIPAEQLDQYDRNIIAHTRHIGRKRDGIRWKYFQYLILLLSEIYLHQYFTNRERLLAMLEKWCRNHAKYRPLPPYRAEHLRKIALWGATGCGKTLLMHVNILQFRHYAKAARQTAKFNRLILLCPNDGLCAQHLQELALSNLPAKLADGAPGLFAEVEVISIHKIRDTEGKSTYAADSFESANVLFVDEGHRGASGDSWREYRHALSRDGFCFEYSATFGQIDDAEMLAEYAKCIWFDYSYYRFYNDGYGKDYAIHNLQRNGFADPAHKRRYLTACLLSFYRQVWTLRQNPQLARDFNIHSPLWAFVGSKVAISASAEVTYERPSDMEAIIDFLAKFLADKRRAINDIAALKTGDAGMMDDSGAPLFATLFDDWRAQSAESLYADICRDVFHADGGAPLRLAKLGGKDEIGLYAGTGPAFGVINIGDAAGFVKAFREKNPERVEDDRHFAASLFDGINHPDSTINLLLGAKKFAEGWNSWRVSTMGLLNVGVNEGTQIIQLFGRGVRLMGYGRGLQRRAHVREAPAIKEADIVENLNVFGLGADFMERFRNYLKRERMEGERVSITLPTIKNLDGAKLKILRHVGGDFMRECIATIPAPTAGQKPPVVQLDWRARISTLSASDADAPAAQQAAPRAVLIPRRFKMFFNQREMYDELQSYKTARGMHNLELPPEVLDMLLADDDWYRLAIADADQEEFSPAAVRRWQGIAVILMQKYLRAAYAMAQNQWEAGRRRYEELTEADSNFVHEYQAIVAASETRLVSNLQRLRDKLIESKQAKTAGQKAPPLYPLNNWHLSELMYNWQLYQPLFWIGRDRALEIKPAAAVLNDDEKRFLQALNKRFAQDADAPNGFFAKRNLYLLRNLTRGRGVGFFEANNFYPDFLLWLTDEATGLQHIAFIDPKGLRNLARTSPKLQFHKTIKQTEADLHDSAPEMRLHAFIVTRTKPRDLTWDVQPSDDDLEDMNIYRADADDYISKILQKITA